MSAIGSILVVDGSRVGLMLQETVLRRRSHQLRTAATGSEAWQMVKRMPPDLVILAWDLTDMTGPELCRRIRGHEASRRVSLLMLTDRASEHSDLCRAAGCNEVLQRPYHRRDLDLLVSRLLTVPARRELRTLTKLRIMVRNEELSALGYSINVSASGMLVQARQILPPEAKVGVHFYLPFEAAPVGLAARVVRAEFEGGAPRYGLEFSGVPAQDRIRIESFVTRVKARESQ